MGTNENRGYANETSCSTRTNFLSFNHTCKYKHCNSFVPFPQVFDGDQMLISNLVKLRTDGETVKDEARNR